MKSSAFEYRCPINALEASQLLANTDIPAKIMAGGQSFGPMLNLRLTRPQLVIDVSRLSEMEAVVSDSGYVILGANVTHSAIEDGVHEVLKDHPIRSVAAGIAYRAIRNRGTVGGSLAHADPAADWIVTLTALNAQLTLSSPRGIRHIAMENFMQAAYTTALAPDEVILSVRVPRADTSRWGYHKFCRKPGEFAEASAAVWLDDARGTARIVLGALDGAPVQLPVLAARIAAEGALATSRSLLADAIKVALPGRDPVDQQWHAVCLARALAQAGVVSPALVSHSEKQN